MKTFLAIMALTFANTAHAEMSQVPPINTITPSSGYSSSIRICTGADGGAYFNKASQMMGLVQAKAKMPVSVEPGGGTYGCLTKMAKGEAEAAIIQMDAWVWAQKNAPDLYQLLVPSSHILDEEMMAVCNRSWGGDELNDIAQNKGKTLTIAGGNTSGSLLTMNVLASFDVDFNLPNWRNASSWEQALSEVKSGVSTCAFGVLSSDSPSWNTLNDEFGKDLRMVGFWDNDMKDLKFNSQRVYGWIAIPKDSDNLDRLLDWNKKGKLWSPEVGAVPAILVYRSDMISDTAGSALANAGDQVAMVKDIHR